MRAIYRIQADARIWGGFARMGWAPGATPSPSPPPLRRFFSIDRRESAARIMARQAAARPTLHIRRTRMFLEII